MHTKGITVIETLISLCIIGALTGVAIVKFYQVLQEARKTAVKTELVNIRTSIQLFRMLNGRNPQSLKELVEKKVILPARVGMDNYSSPVFLKASYLMEHAIGKDGSIIDAFGNPFVYDAIKGEVKTTTRGYEAW